MRRARSATGQGAERRIADQVATTPLVTFARLFFDLKQPNVRAPRSATGQADRRGRENV